MHYPSLPATLLLLVGCGGPGSNEPDTALQGSNRPCNTTDTYLTPVPSAPVADDSNEVPFVFIDIVLAVLSLSDAEVSFDLELAGMPALLPRDEAPSDLLEYGWSAQFDVDGDGTSANDLSIGHSYYSSGDPDTGSFGEFGQTDVWLHRPAGGAERVADARLEVDGANLTVTAQRQDYEGLEAIDGSMSVRFWTTHYSDGFYCDSLPDR